MNIPMSYYCDVCRECYSTENAANKCSQLPLEEVKFSLGDQVIVDACKSTERTGTVVGIKYIAGCSGGKHFASYTVELADKSLVQRNARSLKLYTPEPHPNKQEILDGIAAGREWEFRPTGKDEWINPLRDFKFPSWASYHEYRLKPVPDPHPNKEEVRKGVAAGKAWQYRRKGTSEWINPTQPFGPTFGPTWNGKHEYRLVPVEEPNPHPNRAEVEAGIAAGRTWQCRLKGDKGKWSGPFARRYIGWSHLNDYRLTPEHEYVPLGPEDVPPSTVLRGAGEVDFKGWCMITSCSETGIRLWSHCDSDGREITWKSVKDDDCQINRSLPLTGKWDANAWEPCSKLKQ